MATSGTSSSEKLEHFGRRLTNIYDTLCNNVNIEKVSSMLQGRPDVSKQAKKFSKRAAKSKDPEYLYAVLKKFDFKSFVAFVDVVREIAEDNDVQHLQLLNVICSHFKDLPEFSEPEYQESYSKLKDIITKNEGKKVEVKYRKDDSDETYSEGTTDVTSGLESMTIIKSKQTPIELPSVLLTIQHPVEEEALEYDQNEGIFYSHTHGVCVIVDQQALPEKSLNIVLTVNDYSKHIEVPKEYDASYSALISLKCNPEIDSFLDFVSVTVPHCAFGDKKNLCVLSASESKGDETICLKEDCIIEIDNIDEYYFTFRTKHFTKYKVANARTSRKQKQRRKYPRGTQSLLSGTRKNRSFERSASRDNAESSAGETSESGVGEMEESNHEPINQRFVAIRCEPEHQIESPLKCYFFITYDVAETYIGEVVELASKDWNDSCRREKSDSFKWERSRPFLFKQDPQYITFEPEDNKDGWKLLCSNPPPSLIRKEIVEYFERIGNHSMPYIGYKIYSNEDSPKQTDFLINLRGSWIPILKCEASMRFVCTLQRSTRTNPRAIVLISAMYKKQSPLLEAVRGENPNYKLSVKNYECAILLCEISFHLPQWEKLGSILGMDIDELHLLKDKCDNYYYEAAYKLLFLWIERSNSPPTFQELLSALHHCNLDLVEGSWKECYDTSHLTVLDEEKMLPLSRNIRLLWKFVGRLLGMTNDEIEEVEFNNKQLSLWETAYKMLLQWRRSSQVQHDHELNVRLFNALHCMKDHTGKFGDSLTCLLAGIVQ